MASVRILHASDLHIASVPNLTSPVDRLTPGTVKNTLFTRMLASTYDPTILLELAKFTYQQAYKNMLDAVLLTGDISTTGYREDLEKAFDFVQAPADPVLGWQDKSGHARLIDVNVPLMLVPGNHDRYRNSRIPFMPGGDTFDEIFATEWQGRVMCWQPISKAGLTVTVIAADFSLPSYFDCDGLLGYLGQGCVYQEICDELAEATLGLSDSDRQCVIWAIHFPPSYPGVSHNLKLLNSDLLIQRANDCGIKAVLSGHTHEALKYRRPNMKFDVYCAGTTSQYFAPEGNHFRIIEVNSDNAGNVSINSEEYFFDNDRSRFRPL